MIDDLATVYRYDQRACARSLGNTSYTLSEAVADLERLREHWGVERWVVGGHSWGATLGLAYTLLYPQRVRALLYISGTGIDPTWHATFHANDATLHDAAEQQQLAALKQQIAVAEGEELATLNRHYCELSWSANVADRSRGREIARQLFVGDLQPNYVVNERLSKDGDNFIEADNIPPRLAAVDTPTLVVHGEADPRAAKYAQQVAELIPSTRFVVLPNVSHLPWLEQPTLTRQLLRGFLQDQV